MKRIALAAAFLIGVASPALAQPGDAPAPTTTPPALITPGAAQPADAAHPAPDPKPTIYDANADARADIAAALARAKADNKRVLIQWGAEWCGWCHVLDKAFKTTPEFSRELMYEYEWVHVDIAQWDKNLDLADQYHADFKAHGVPYLTVLDSEGNVVTNQDTGSLETGDNDSPGYVKEKVLGFLQTNKAPAQDAKAVLDAALKKAKAEDKRVFLHFGAPWCGWCHKLEGWMAREQVAKTLAKDFVPVKIDTDRMTGGAELLMRFTNGRPSGIPYSVFLDPDMSVVAPVVGENGENLGCPWTDEEIASFGKVLDHACRNIGEQERASLLAALKAEREGAGAGH